MIALAMSPAEAQGPPLSKHIARVEIATIPAGVLAVLESGRVVVAQRQGRDTARLQEADQELFQGKSRVSIRVA